ncbi:hypothetical protein D7Y27_22430 [Corallococcus sp. AB004]|nr:hypothetical protein D7Y27_22430 [Corallococcus sp. AB004]
MDTGAVQAALLAWVQEGTGVPCALVPQNGFAQPAGAAYATLRLTTLRPSGGAVLTQEVDMSRPGEEVEVTASSLVEVVAAVQVFEDLPKGVARALAVERLARARQRLELPGVLGRLAEAGLGLLDAGVVLDITGVAGVAWQSRASLEVRLYAVESAAERTTFIETVGVSTPLQR